MDVTLSVIKADIGSIGGHICPSQGMPDTVRRHVAEHGRSLLIDRYISHTGDDIAIVMRSGSACLNTVRAEISGSAAV